jgi:tetraacyldisaccharide 4'-kinase
MLARFLASVWWQPRPGWAALALRPLAALYGVLAARAHRRGLARRLALPVPVLVVGNWVVGGAGKTPTVIALVQALRAAGWTPGVISRGHGSAGQAPREVQPAGAPECTDRGTDRGTGTGADAWGDEPLLIRRRTGAPVVVGRDRPAAARRLLELHPAVTVLVSDDGLQHAALPRDLQVIVFDERGIGNGLLLPAGPLRAPLPAQPPPRSLVLFNAPARTVPWPGWMAQRRLAGALRLDDWAAGAAAQPGALTALQGRPVWAAAGVAHPERFFAMLEAAGLRLHRLPLADHARLDTLPWPPDADDVLVTEKDAVKLAGRATGRTRVWVVPLDFAPDPAFVHALLALLGPAPAHPRSPP